MTRSAERAQDGASTTRLRELRLRLPREIFAAFGVGELLDLWDDCGDVRLRSVSCDGAAGTVMLEVDDSLAVEPFESLDYVETFELVGRAPEYYEYLLRLELPRCRAQLDERAGEFFIDGPLRLTESGLTFTAVATQEALERVGAPDEVDGAMVGWEVLRIGEYTGRRRQLEGLTERQLEVLTAAFEQDYFDVPRGVSADELAAQFDLDKSTVLEHLRRAQRNLLAGVFGRSRAERG